MCLLQELAPQTPEEQEAQAEVKAKQK